MDGAPEPQPPASPSPPSPWLRFPWKWRLAALGGLAVVLGGSFTVLLLGRGIPASPLPASELPTALASLQRGRLDLQLGRALGLRRTDVPKAALFSLLAARLCGGVDLFAELMEEGAPAARPRLEGSTEELRRGLVCGRDLAARGLSGADPGWTFTLADGRALELVPARGLATLPNTVSRLRPTSEGHCWFAEGAPLDAPCPADAPLVVRRLEGHWLAGPRGAVDAERADADRGATTRALLDLADGVRRDALVTASRPEHFRVEWLVAPAPPGSEQLLALLQREAVAVALGEPALVGKRRLRVLAREKDGAQRIAVGLTDWVQRLRAFDPPRREEPGRAELEALRLAAMREATVEVSGREVRLHAVDPEDRDLRRAVDAWHDAREQRAVLAGSVVAALIEGQAPPRPALERLLR